MQIADYPPQEPFNPNAARYHDEVMARGADPGPSVESRYGEDPYQCGGVSGTEARRPDARLHPRLRA